MLLITGVAFFALVLGSGPLTPALASIGLTPLMAAVLARPPSASRPPETASLCVFVCEPCCLTNSTQGCAALSS